MVCVWYGLTRATRDVDVVAVVPWKYASEFQRLAGRDSRLDQKHRVYLQIAHISRVPDNYVERLSEMFPGAFRHLRLLALDPYDLALSKLERNQDVDIEDAKYLARTVPLDVETLRQRYMHEVRPYLGNPEREDITLDLWVEAIQEERAAGR